MDPVIKAVAEGLVDQRKGYELAWPGPSGKHFRVWSDLDDSWGQHLHLGESAGGGAVLKTASAEALDRPSSFFAIVSVPCV